MLRSIESTRGLLLALLLGVLVHGSAVAAAQPQPSSEETAAPDIEAIAARYREAGAISGRFAQTRRLAGFDMALATTGRFLQVPGEGFRIEYDPPLASTHLMRDGVTWQLDPDTATWTQSLVPPEVGELLAAVLRLDLDALAGRFDWQVEAARIVLQPVPTALEARVIGEVELRFGVELERVAIVHVNGDATTLTFTDVRRDATAGPEQLAALQVPGGES